jgi:UDP-2,3-diacylglucosamine pyrophosphatase LpxH
MHEGSLVPASTHGSRARVVERVDPDQPIWIVSDLHLGDGTPSDAFFGKDRHLIALIDRVEAEGGVLIVNGDAIDFHQAWSFMRVLRAHQALLAAMSRLGREGRLFYVIGNHDYDISVFRDVLNLRVCEELHIGDEVLVCHGYRYDPYITEMLDSGQWHTKVHHAVERFAGTWIRIPMSEFYTLTNRFVFWLGHKIGLAAWAVSKVGERLGVETVADEVLANLDFWAWSNMGDSMGIFRPAWHEARTGRFRMVVCGHSHLPGIVRDGDRAYANTGSWTFASSQYLVWRDHDLRCFDWITGREYHDELYQPMLDGTLYERDIFQWWKENYMGLLRFREGEERLGRLRGWQSYMRDYQVLSQLREIAEPEVPPPPPRKPLTQRAREAALARRRRKVESAEPALEVVAEPERQTAYERG